LEIKGNFNDTTVKKKGNKKKQDSLGVLQPGMVCASHRGKCGGNFQKGAHEGVSLLKSPDRLFEKPTIRTGGGRCGQSD